MESNSFDKMSRQDNDGAERSQSSSKKTSSPSLGVSDRLGLEEIVHLANRIGLEYATAKKECDHLELMRATVRARIMIRLDDGEMSENRLRRFTETDAEYVTFLENLSNARGETEKLRIRYESYKNLFEARRSLLSYQKAEMKLI